jgi:pimeloyl-ACP methyl ester carboxylesterase
MPLVLVHGYLGGAEQWREQISYLSASFDVIVPSLPGYGDAADWPTCDRIGALADAVVALLDHLGVTEFILLGHSMGGMIAQAMAAKVGNRVRRLILYGTGPVGLLPDRFESIEVSMERLRTDGVAKTAKRIAATWFKDGETAQGFALVAQLGARTSRQAALSGLDAMAHWDGRSALGTLKMPTLVMWGEKDRSYSWAQIEMLWKTVPKAELAVMPGAAHAAHLEKPKLFHAILDDFLGTA